MANVIDIIIGNVITYILLPNNHKNIPTKQNITDHKTGF